MFDYIEKIPKVSSNNCMLDCKMEEYEKEMEENKSFCLLHY